MTEITNTTGFHYESSDFGYWLFNTPKYRTDIELSEHDRHTILQGLCFTQYPEILK